MTVIVMILNKFRIIMPPKLCAMVVCGVMAGKVVRTDTLAGVPVFHVTKKKQTYDPVFFFAGKYKRCLRQDT